MGWRSKIIFELYGLVAVDMLIFCSSLLDHIISFYYGYGGEHFDDPATPPYQEQMTKEKKHSGFSLFRDIVNSWLDTQID